MPGGWHFGAGLSCGGEGGRERGCVSGAFGQRQRRVLGTTPTQAQLQHTGRLVKAYYALTHSYCTHTQKASQPSEPHVIINCVACFAATDRLDLRTYRRPPTPTQTHRLDKMSCRIGGEGAAGGALARACFVLPSSPLLLPPPPPSIKPHPHPHQLSSPWLAAAAPLPPHAVSPLFQHKHGHQHPERQPPEGRRERWKPLQVCM